MHDIRRPSLQLGATLMPRFSSIDDYEVPMTTFDTLPRQLNDRVSAKAHEYVTPSGEAFDKPPAYCNNTFSQACQIKEYFADY